MPKIEVRALDLNHLTATSLHDENSSFLIPKLSYVWVQVHDIMTGAEMWLRFKVADNKLLLRSSLRLPRLVEDMESELRRALIADPGEFQWYAKMIHFSVSGLGQVGEHAIAIGDNLQVDAHGSWQDFWVKPKVNFGEVAQILAFTS